MNNIRRKILITLSEISGSGLTYFLWKLQETKSANPTAEETAYELKCGILAFAIVVFVNILAVFSEWRYKDRVCRDWLRSLMEVVYTDVGRDAYMPRISIYRPMLGFWLFFRYVFCIGPHVMFRNGFSKIPMFWKNAPWHWGRTYLYLWERKVTENECCSQTVIKTTYVNDPGNGVVDHFYRLNKSGTKQTTAISNINLPSSNPFSQNYVRKIGNIQLSENDLKKLNTYFDESYLDKNNYDFFNAMQRHSTDFHVTILTDSNQKKWGVMLIESDVEKDKTFKEMLDDKTERYAQLFSSLHQIV